MSIHEWRKKRDFLEKELAKEADATQKFKLDQEINECNKKIQELEARQFNGNPRTLKPLLLKVGAIFGVGLTGLVGFQLYRQTTWRYAHLENLLSQGEWKKADDETAQKMREVAGIQKEQKLTEEHFNFFPCEDLRTIDELWKKYSKGHYGFSSQRHIWLSSDVRGDLGKFVVRVGWGQFNNDGSFYYYFMDGIRFDLNGPTGRLPWAPTYDGGNHKTRREYMSRILRCIDR